MPVNSDRGERKEEAVRRGKWKTGQSCAGQASSLWSLHALPGFGSRSHSPTDDSKVIVGVNVNNCLEKQIYLMDAEL